MNSDILNYLQQNFYTMQQLAEISGVTETRIDQWIQLRCLPAHSYKISTDGAVHSFFGVVENVSSPGEEKCYFNPSHIVKIKALEETGQPSQDMADKIKHSFCQDYITILNDKQMIQFGMADHFNPDGSNDETLDQLLESEWAYYLDGIYGFCTKRARTSEIALKETMIKKINFLTDEATKAHITDDEKKSLSDAVNCLDQVSSQFSPHEFERSSRNKYIVKIRAKYHLLSDSEQCM